MKTAFKSFFAGILLFSIAASPLWAQASASGGTGTNNAAAAPSVSIDRTGIHLVGSPNPGEIKLSTGVLLQNLVAILGFFGTIAAVAGIIGYFRSRRNKMLHETLRAMVEKGVAIPLELIARPNRTRHPSSDLRWGVVLAGFGIGVMTLVVKVGLIFMFIGLAFLIVWMVERKNRNNEPAEK
ncbi:MAG TPA: DUF6249 domain-containing protein [Opitutaceae bacterium]|nr:DUF6249 domain-containing protein [Opitutaceae bacterium]